MVSKDRRSFLALVLGAGAAGFSPIAYAAKPAYPAKEALQSGDLLWPKRPGVFIPYSSDNTAETDRVDWEKNKQRVIAQLEENINVNTAPQISALADLSYSEFRQRYFNGVTAGRYVEYGTAGVAAVGHVGIADVDPVGNVSIIDANPGPGVASTPYARWIADRPDHVVWVGRLRGKSAEERTRIAGAARQYLGAPYDFWNFDLGDPAGFYCSKLVWLATIKALAIALDDDPQPKRSFWLSPKQLLASAHVEIVLDQGDFMWD